MRGNIETIEYTGTGAAKTLAFGFPPSVVKIFNPFKGLVAIWRSSNPTETAILSDYVDGLLDDPVPQIGTTDTAVATLAFRYMIAGIPYTKAAVAAGTAPGNDVVPEDKYGAVALDTASDGTLDAIEAADNATGYATEALAIAGLADPGASHIRVCIVTAMKSDGAFTFGTTALDADNATVSYYSGGHTTSGRIITTTGIVKYGDAVGDSYYGVELGTSDYINKVGATYIAEATRSDTLS